MSDRIPERLRLLHVLYEGDDDLLDPSSESELHDLRAMKALLDARSRRRPDPTTVRAVLEAARGEHAAGEARSASSVAPGGRVRSAQPVHARSKSTRADRDPAPRDRSSTLRMGALTALVVLLVAAVGLFQLQLLRPTAEIELPELFSEESAGNAAASGTEETGGAQDPGAAAHAPTETEDPSSLRRDVVAEQLSSDDPLMPRLEPTGSADPLRWDDREEVIEVYEDIRMIGSAVAEGWEPPSVPLEMFPPPSGARGSYLQEAGRRTP